MERVKSFYERSGNLLRFPGYSLCERSTIHYVKDPVLQNTPRTVFE